MKYIRTKDGRIVKECNLESGFKQTIITIKSKKDNKELRQIVCDDLDDYLEMVVVGEYCKCHKINPKDIKYETTTLFNEILKQADTIDELCDEIIGILNKNIECERYETSLKIGDKLWFDDLEDAKYNKKYCSEIYGAIWTDKGLIYVAKMNGKGELELL